jgi:hypothetical protein
MFRGAVSITASDAPRYFRAQRRDVLPRFQGSNNQSNAVPFVRVARDFSPSPSMAAATSDEPKPHVASSASRGAQTPQDYRTNRMRLLTVSGDSPVLRHLPLGTARSTAQPKARSSRIPRSQLTQPVTQQVTLRHAQVLCRSGRDAHDAHDAPKRKKGPRCRTEANPSTARKLQNKPNAASNDQRGFCGGAACAQRIDRVEVAAPGTLPRKPIRWAGSDSQKIHSAKTKDQGPRTKDQGPSAKILLPPERRLYNQH